MPKTSSNICALWRTDRIIADIKLLASLDGPRPAGIRGADRRVRTVDAGAVSLFRAGSDLECDLGRGHSCVVNFAIAALPFAVASRPASGRELELANEIHGTSVDALQLEVRALQSKLSGMIHHRLNGVLPLLIVPLITIIIKSLKRPPARAINRTGRSRATIAASGSARGDRET